MANLKEKDRQLGEVAEQVSGEIEVGETRGVPPGFEQAALANSESQIQPETGVQLAEEALAAPSHQITAPSGSLSQASMGFTTPPHQEGTQPGTKRSPSTSQIPSLQRDAIAALSKHSFGSLSHQ